MTEGKHTPGPWNLEPNGPAFNLHSPECFSHFCVLVGMQSLAEGKHEANARLIAAAPELLAALERATPWLAKILADVGEGEREPPTLRKLWGHCISIQAKAKGIS